MQIFLKRSLNKLNTRPNVMVARGRFLLPEELGIAQNTTGVIK